MKAEQSVRDLRPDDIITLHETPKGSLNRFIVFISDPISGTERTYKARLIGVGNSRLNAWKDAYKTLQKESQ